MTNDHAKVKKRRTAFTTVEDVDNFLESAKKKDAKSGTKDRGIKLAAQFVRELAPQKNPTTLVIRHALHKLPSSRWSGAHATLIETLRQFYSNKKEYGLDVIPTLETLVGQLELSTEEDTDDLELVSYAPKT